MRFFRFRPEIPFLSKIGRKKIKIVSLSWNLVPRLIRICKIQWWCSLCPFFIGSTLFGQTWSRNQNCLFKLKFGTSTNLHMQNSMVLFIFSVWDQKQPFWANLVQKIRLVSLGWTLVPRVIRIYRIQWWCSFFLF